MNFFKKLQLKRQAKSKSEYQQLKEENRKIAVIQEYNNRMSDFVRRAQEVLPPVTAFPINRTINVKHSGQLGDVIYCIPAMQTFSGDQGVNLYLHLNQPVQQEPFWSHPLGNVLLNDKIYQMAEPLLKVQPAIRSYARYEKEKIDVDFDIFRELPWNHHKGHISRWHFLYYPGSVDLSKQWLTVPSVNPIASEGIVVCRSQRYNAPGIDYSFLKKYPEVYFLGVENEYQLLKQSIPSLTYLPVKDFLEMASIIAGAKLFIGNQSAPFAMAEGLKVNRLLETYFDCPNVIIEGDTGFEFCFQPQFELLVKKRYENL